MDFDAHCVHVDARNPCDVVCMGDLGDLVVSYIDSYVDPSIHPSWTRLPDRVGVGAGAQKVRCARANVASARSPPHAYRRKQRRLPMVLRK
jgi:hypothetical protein